MNWSDGPPNQSTATDWHAQRESTFLSQAIELAGQNAAAGQLPFGALVVRDGGVLATGVNTELSEHDPTAHAEVDAVRKARRDLRTLTLAGAVLVSSCEPCALCRATAAVAGIERVVYAASKELAAAMLSAPEDGAAALRVVHAPPAGDSLPFER